MQFRLLSMRGPSAIQFVLPPVRALERAGNSLTAEHIRCGHKRRELQPAYPELRLGRVAGVAPELLATEIPVALASSRCAFDAAID